MNNAIVNGKLALEAAAGIETLDIPAPTTHTPENVSSIVTQFVHIEVTDIEYPSRAKATLMQDAPTLYAAGNLNLLRTEPECVLTSSYSSPKSKRSAESLVRLIAQGYAAHERSVVPTILLSSNVVTDQGTRDERTGEYVFEGLLTTALNAGCNVILFKAGEVNTKLLEGLPLDRFLLLSTVNPDPISGEQGSLEHSVMRSLVVSLMARRVFVIEVAYDNIPDMVNNCLIQKTEVYMMGVKTCSVKQGRSIVQKPSQNRILMIKGAKPISSAEQIIDMM